MEKLSPVALAFANSKPLRSLGNRAPSLTLVRAKMPTKSQQNSTDAPPSLERVAVLQVLLSAERTFLRRLQELVEEKCSKADDLEDLKQKVNNEDVFQIARFFFLLEELNCSTPDAVEELLESHNRRIQKLINDGELQFGSHSVLKRASFDDNQISTCIRTIKQKNRPVFSKQEIASLVFEQMRRDKAIRTIDLMVDVKLLTEESAQQRERQRKLRTSNRSYIMTDGRIEDAVAQYLEAVQSGLREVM